MGEGSEAAGEASGLGEGGPKRRKRSQLGQTRGTGAGGGARDGLPADALD